MQQCTELTRTNRSEALPRTKQGFVPEDCGAVLRGQCTLRKEIPSGFTSADAAASFGFGFEGTSLKSEIVHYLQKNANSVFFLIFLCYNELKFEIVVDFFSQIWQNVYAIEKINGVLII